MAGPIVKAFEDAATLDRAMGVGPTPYQTMTLKVTFRLADLRDLREAMKGATRSAGSINMGKSR